MREQVEMQVNGWSSGETQVNVTVDGVWHWLRVCHAYGRDFVWWKGVAYYVDTRRGVPFDSTTGKPYG